MSDHDALSADALLRENAQMRDYIERLRRWGTRLLRVIDTHPDLIPVYAASLKWRIDGPPPPTDNEDPTEVGTLQSEIARLRTDRAGAAEALRAAQAAETAERAARVRWESTLAWYADVGNYDAWFAPGVLDPQAGTWHVDGGERARAALAPNDER